MKHTSCPSLEVLATRFDAHVILVEERKKNDEERRVQLSENLKLQAAETARRLYELNHAHDQAEKKNQDYVSKNMHEAAVREMNQKHDQFVQTITQKNDALQKLVYIGLGLVLATQLALTLFFGKEL